MVVHPETIGYLRGETSLLCQCSKHLQKSSIRHWLRLEVSRYGCWYFGLPCLVVDDLVDGHDFHWIMVFVDYCCYADGCCSVGMVKRSVTEGMVQRQGL